MSVRHGRRIGVQNNGKLWRGRHSNSVEYESGDATCADANRISKSVPSGSEHKRLFGPTAVAKLGSVLHRTFCKYASHEFRGWTELPRIFGRLKWEHQRFPVSQFGMHRREMGLYFYIQRSHGQQDRKSVV